MTFMDRIKTTKDICTVIDIGNSKVSCLIGLLENTAEKKIKVLGFGQHVSLGINCGKITDMKEIANSIARAVEGAETMAGFSINKVTCNISGGNPITKVLRKEVQVEHEQICKNDVLRIQKLSEPNKIDNYKILSSSVMKFYVDNQRPVDNPIGIHTKKLTLDMTHTYGYTTIIKNISSAVALCHLSVEKFIITPEASGEAVLIDEEKNKGAILIDLGGSITSVAIFKNKKIVFSDSIPIGGLHITSDIVRGLGCKAEDAEKLKILHGSALSNETDEYNNVEVTIITDDGEIRDHIIPKAMLTAIIRPRIEEIFELIKIRLFGLGLLNTNMSQIILCGGGANLRNIRELAANFFEKNVRIGLPFGVSNLPEIVHSPTFACLVGLLIKDLKKESFHFDYKVNPSFLNNFGRLGKWFDQNL